MKKIFALSILFSIAFVACKSEKSTKEKENSELALKYDSFGDQINDKDVLTSEEMMVKYKDLQVGDTIDIKFESKIADVCAKKGCWMKLPLNAENETMVKFKDYGFFMPLDSKGREVIVAGKAFVQVTSVEELKHYAEDAGKTKEEIAKITEPKKEMSFEANGVLIKAD